MIKHFHREVEKETGLVVDVGVSHTRLVGLRVIAVVDLSTFIYYLEVYCLQYKITCNLTSLLTHLIAKSL